MNTFSIDLPPPQIRTVGDMCPVLYCSDCNHGKPLYFMYRDVVKHEQDRIWLNSLTIRYDITVIPPADMGGEYVKTKGHYHPDNPEGVGYPEIYEVLEGRADFLLQKKTLDDIVLVRATAGDIVCIPPGYGHVTINPSPDKTLSMANLVSTRFESEYKEYERLHGAAYYELTGEWLEKNPRYPEIPEIRIVSAKDCPHPWGASHASLYDFIGDDAIALLLNYPEKFMGRFEIH